tara:strand:- start:400 stop:993 length:594 start_codon:yes stop_codon:yes gene_type:complete
VKCDSEGINTAKKILEKDGVIIFPTDTVYGIGCNPYSTKAIQRIYQIKKRDEAKPLPILGYSKDELNKIVFFDEKSSRLIDKFWPGKLTLVLKLKDQKLKETMRLSDKVAVRVPNNKCVLSLLKECKLLIGTSANTSGTSSLIDSKDCNQQLSNYDILIDYGRIQSDGESTIIEINNGELNVIRIGSISEEEILDVI